MSFAVTNLNVPASVAASDTLQKEPGQAATLYYTGGATATAQPQVSLDGTNWLDDGTALTANGTHAFLANAPYIRVNVTAYTSGTPVGNAFVG